MNLEQYMIPCLSKTLFGLECFGCGFQRAFLLLLDGKFMDAFKMYPAIYTTFIFFAIISLQFIDKHHNYQKYIITMAVIEGIFMIFGYYLK